MKSRYRVTPELTITSSDVSAELRQAIYDMVYKAWKAEEVYTEEDFATFIKTQLDSQGDESGGWHVIVGLNFAAEITAETETLWFAQFGAHKILAFKHG